MITQFIIKVGEWIASNNPFTDVDFSDLYSWLPLDISNAVGIVISISIVLFCIGILKKVFSW